jgi:hypothetical protein
VFSYYSGHPYLLTIQKASTARSPISAELLRLPSSNRNLNTEEINDRISALQENEMTVFTEYCHKQYWNTNKQQRSRTVAAGKYGCILRGILIIIIIIILSSSIIIITDRAICTVNSTHRIAATLCILETWFVSGA